MSEGSSRFAKGCGALVGCLTLLVVGGGGLLLVVVFAAGTAFNAGPVQVPVDGDWKVEGQPDRSAVELARMVEQCAPMVNGINVWWQHLWYNAMSSGYDERVWLEGPSYQSYGLYVWGDHVFLRDENGRDGYRNRVLTCDRPLLP